MNVTMAPFMTPLIILNIDETLTIADPYSTYTRTGDSEFLNSVMANPTLYQGTVRRSLTGSTVTSAGHPRLYALW